MVVEHEGLIVADEETPEVPCHITFEGRPIFPRCVQRLDDDHVEIDGEGCVAHATIKQSKWKVVIGHWTAKRSDPVAKRLARLDRVLDALRGLTTIKAPIFRAVDAWPGCCQDAQFVLSVIEAACISLDGIGTARSADEAKTIIGNLQVQWRGIDDCLVWLDGCTKGHGATSHVAEARQAHVAALPIMAKLEKLTF